MNQQQRYDYPPPPPTPHPLHGSPGSALEQQRRRVAPAPPPSIATNVVRVSPAGVPSQTPLSAISPFALGGYTPSTPVALNSRSPSSSLVPPGTPMEPYNPRQWSGRPQVSGAQMVFQQRANAANTRDVTGMETSMPSPPPPYSPDDTAVENTPVAVRASPMLESVGFVASPLRADASRGSPQVPMSPSFPPPPGQPSRYRERSGSGLANQRGFFSLSGLRNKQPANVDPQPSQVMQAPQLGDPKPPAARRAASTGHLQSVSAGMVGGSGTTGRTTPENGWQPGMPLPGPPPGPPPAGARSQSLNRYPTGSSSNSGTPERSITSPHDRRTAAVSNLGPIPPTPADWTDSDTGRQQDPQPNNHQPPSAEPSESSLQPLRIDTGTNKHADTTRRSARQESSSQCIRERRSRSRAARDGTSDAISPVGDDSKPKDLVFSTIDGTLSKRRMHVRNISGFSEAGKALRPDSPMVITHAGGSSQPASAPPTTTSVLTPPYTPAVKSGDDSLRRRSALRVPPGSASSDRPLSHLLHAPNNDEAGMPAPLSPARPPSRPPSSGSMKGSTRLDAFCLQALERHRTFIEKEAAATSDEERLELFANFMVHESRLRRDRYASAYNAMAGDIVDLTRDMWRSYMKQTKRAGTPSTSMSSSDPTVPSWASDGQPPSAHGNVPSSASSLGDFTPGTESGSMLDSGEGAERSESRGQWGESFKPSLSPIPSMNVSTVHDDQSSRGRTASRWWENSNSGSNSGSIGKPGRIEKSHRETKYMGVIPAALQENDQPSPSPGHSRHTPTPGASTQTFGYEPNDYPPEKVGLHEAAEYDTPLATPHRQGERQSYTPGGTALDVSRLVTLPPPYPRHHPAVNNSHPLLSDLRNEHRALADQSAIREIKDAYVEQDSSIVKAQEEAAKERRRKLRANIQEQITQGSISFAEAAQAESDFDAEEAERGKANARSNFDVFEASVSHPLNRLLTERLQNANAAINQLRAELDSRNEVSDPNQAQEEGDEQPERLEKLTLLKWLFEAREQLHKEMFDLHGDRSAKYSDVILTPYRIAKLQAKIDEATAFFKKDRIERQTTFAKDSVKRFEELQQIMETNVTRGVEDQLSAFWDIAPALLEVIQHVPGRRVGELEIGIPAREYDENPAYEHHPLQYLYSLLSHAEKSAYQFIESQTNLLCLLHEVRTATNKSSLRLLEIQRGAARPDDSRLSEEMRDVRRAQEQKLTEDLQDKVGEVERQWQEALGDGIADCKRWVRAWLEGSGGWEDGLDG